MDKMDKPAYVPLNAGKVFTGKKSLATVMGFSKPGPLTPARNPDYIWPEWLRYDVIPAFIDWRDNLWIAGPSGCGKTEGIKQVCALLNYPVYELTGQGRLEMPELVGHHTVVDGSMSWVDGPLTAAMRDGGVFLLNEIDLVEASTLAGLNTILDGSPLVIADNGAEVVEPHPAFKFIATANTNGSGDDGGLYTGTLRQNVALQSRFMVIPADYISSDEERGLLGRLFGELPEAIRDVMVRFARLVRMADAGGERDSDTQDADYMTMASGINAVVGTRDLVRWARLTLRNCALENKGKNVLEYSMLRAISADKVSETVMCELLQRLVEKKEK